MRMIDVEAKYKFFFFGSLKNDALYTIKHLDQTYLEEEIDRPTYAHPPSGIENMSYIYEPPMRPNAKKSVDRKSGNTMSLYDFRARSVEPGQSQDHP